MFFEGAMKISFEETTIIISIENGESTRLNDQMIETRSASCP